MTQSILIVNDVATNRIVLNVRLSTARYTVVQANNGADALDVLREQKIDMVLLDMDLPDMTGPELCARIRRLPMGREIPLLISTETNDLRLKKAALAAGADDYLQRPVDEKLLLARVRSLFRARATKAELQLRDGTARALGFAEGVSTFEMPGHVGLIAEGAKKRAEIQHNLTHKSRHAITPLSRLEALGLASDEPVPDVFLVVADRDFHGASLSVLTELRSNPETRHSMVMMVLPGFAIDDSAIALDLGADDLVMDGFNPDELALRLNALVQRKRQNDALRARVKDGLKAAVIDPLTGLYNRRYAISHLARVAETSTETGKSFAVMLLDLDHFKQINDTYGHAVGDDVLCAVAQRLQDNLHPFDLVARIGGEEFLVAMPNSPESQAIQAANRLCEIIAATPIRLPKHGVEVSISTSIGVAIGTPDCECPDRISELLQSADVALYRAKSDGRNQVLLSQTAA